MINKPLEISKGQIWSNNYTRDQVKVEEVTEYNLTLITATGFTYDYPFGQFLAEYSYVAER